MLDEEGNDVTPATLFHGDPVVAKGVSKASVLGDTDAQVINDSLLSDFLLF